MNRSILIVIADFLLISLLAFSSFDASKLVMDRPETKSPPKLNPDTLAGNKDLTGVLKVALDDERRARNNWLDNSPRPKRTFAIRKPC